MWAMPQNLKVKTAKKNLNNYTWKVFLNHILPKITREAWFSPNIFKKSRANCFIRVLFAISESKIVFLMNKCLMSVELSLKPSAMTKIKLLRPTFNC